jgi:16S rRNA C967 or C1407 C5-methylase (RsmB/RsmF family)
VQAFLDRHAGFALVPLDRAWPTVASSDPGVPDPAPPNPAPPNLGPPNLGPPNLGPPKLGPPKLGPPKLGPPCPGEMLVLTPRQHGTDGFFAAVLERSA